jgi:hypothetical protein
MDCNSSGVSVRVENTKDSNANHVAKGNGLTFALRTVLMGAPVRLLGLGSEQSAIADIADIAAVRIAVVSVSSESTLENWVRAAKGGTLENVGK